jgi:DNA-binding CsgD family transcriptional regulator
MPNFSQISTTQARRIDRAMLSLADVETLGELEQRFIQTAGKLLPADCICWNNWSKDMSHLMTYRTNDKYNERFDGLLDVFAETVSEHPVIAANKLDDTLGQVMRISDFQPTVEFRENPLFREVYQHLDAHYQICFTASILQDRRLILTWNRRALDFTDQDAQVFHYMGIRLGLVSRRIEQRERLENAWKGLCEFVNQRMANNSVASLGERDGYLLAELLKSRPRGQIAADMGIRRDSLDKRLGAIRERLGLENHHQLLSALAALRTGS